MDKSKGKSVQHFFVRNFPILLQIQVLKCVHMLRERLVNGKPYCLSEIEEYFFSCPVFLMKIIFT